MRVPTSQFRQSARTLAKHPGFAIVAILSLALAIAVNTTMYSMLDALINPRIDMKYRDRVVMVGFWGDRQHKVTPQQQNALLLSVNDFDMVSPRGGYDMRVLFEAAPNFRNGNVAIVAANYFDMYGITPLHGRLFRSEDVRATTRPAVISERLARHLFPKVADPTGRTLSIEGSVYGVIGVLSRTSDFPQSSTLAWVLPPPGTVTSAQPIGLLRRRTGVTFEKVHADLKRLEAQYAVLAGQAPRDVQVGVGSAGGRVWFRAGDLHYAMILAVLAVLLVACANLANLQLARGIARSRELATRAALGASRRDLVRHLLSESALLAGAGLVVGLVLTFWGMHALVATIPESINEYVIEPQTSWRLFVFAGLAAGVCVLLIGLLPAVRVSRVDLNDLIKSGSGTGSTRGARRQYGMLIAAEVAFALALVCGAAVLVQSAVQMHDQAVSYDESKLTEATLQVGMPSWTFASVASEIVARMRQLPDVEDADVALGRAPTDNQITATDPGGKLHVIPAAMWHYAIVTPSWARTLGYEIAHGRNFLEGEQGAVAIVDPQMARRLWPNTEAVGHMIKFGTPYTPGRWYKVIGVRKPVGLESQATLTSDIGNVVVLATPSDTLTGTPVGTTKWSNKNVQIGVTVRARSNPQRLPVAVRQTLAGDKRFLSVWAYKADEDQQRRQANQNFIGALFSAFAALALALAALGVYGIVAYSVAERRREIGVRLALGSGSRGILRAVMREGNVYVLAGLALGLSVVKWDARLVRAFLVFPEIDIYSVQLYAPAAVLLFATAVVAALIPALRATRIDPVESLRCE